MAEYISVMAADSKPFSRGSDPLIFKGCLGVCLGFSKPAEFYKIYDVGIRSILKETTGERHRDILKSFDLRQLFGEDYSAYVKALASFVKILSENKILISCAFTTLNTQKLPDGIPKYGTGRSPVKKINPMQFIDELNECYDYVTAWKIVKTLGIRNTTIYLDHFTGEITHAWDELCYHHKVTVIPKGDSCNPFISACDIVTKYIDGYLFQKHLLLDETGIARAFESCDVSSPHVLYLGHGDLQDIVPIKKEQIDCYKHYTKPMTYILKEGLFNAESKIIENSPLYQKILQFAYEKGTGIKFLSFEEDNRKIRQGDHIIYLGENGKKHAEYLNKLGYNIVPIDIHNWTTQSKL